MISKLTITMFIIWLSLFLSHMHYLPGFLVVLGEEWVHSTHGGGSGMQEVKGWVVTLHTS